MAAYDFEQICFQYACPRYLECARARGKGCCVDYPEDESLVVGREACGAGNGFPLFAAQGRDR